MLECCLGQQLETCLAVWLGEALPPWAWLFVGELRDPGVSFQGTWVVFLPLQESGQGQPPGTVGEGVKCLSQVPKDLG